MSWYGILPDRWDALPIRKLFNERKIKVSDVDFVPLSVGKYGTVPQRDNVAKSSSSDNRKLVMKGDYVINSRSDRKGSSGLSAFDGSVSLIYHVLTPRDEISGPFAHYLIRSYDFTEEFYRNGRGIVADLWTTGYQEMRNIIIPIPPRDEQDQIVQWLEWRISYINKLVRSKRREIECLKELKYSIISTAVTQGINANVNMKDSGVKWLGTIPSHWQVSTIKKHFRIKKIIAGNEGYNVLSITQHGLKVKNVKSNEGQIAQDYSGYQFVNPGDFAMNHMDLITGYVDYSKIYGVTSPDYRVFQLRNDSEDSPEYFLKLLQNCYHRRIFYTFGRGAAEKGRWRLPRENFEAFDIPVPPFEEQEAIADYLKKKCKEIDDLSLKLRKEISLVEEYKTRIISDAVTGKIDLRDIEVPNYEAVEDESATADDENGTEEDLGDDEN
ncbi:MAG: restriction endonuclease subunit S [Sphaerochaetaceae bacterium]|nr:restriction endonuclease subunit S [Sphaerochaetaceae bacterium]